MKIQSIRWLTFVVLLTAALALAACGGGNSSPTQAPAQPITRRTVAPTRAPGSGAQPTQDTLNDSSGSTDSGVTPGTPDTLNDSPGNATGQPTSAPAATGPQTQNGKIVLTDTLWNLDKDKQIYRFCKSGRWDVLQGGSTVIKTGTYQSDGDNVTVKNNADQKTIKYQIAWTPDTNTVDLKDGATTLTLKYTAAANCK